MPRPRGGWRPVLLSGLVFPGLGQAVAGRPWRALFFSASSLALVATVVVRVMWETQRLMPVDPEALLDLTLPLTLLVEIHRANASFFSWATLGIVALWAGGIADAWIGKGTVRTVPRGVERSRRPSGTRGRGADRTG